MNHPGKILPEAIRMLSTAPATINYPAEKAVVPSDFRGRIVFDSKLCIGCKLCMRDCPAKAIVIEPTGVEKVFKSTFYLDQCIYCAQCVDTCPKKALASTPQFELANYNRAKLKETQE